MINIKMMQIICSGLQNHQIPTQVTSMGDMGDIALTLYTALPRYPPPSDGQPFENKVHALILRYFQAVDTLDFL